MKYRVAEGRKLVISGRTFRAGEILKITPNPIETLLAIGAVEPIVPVDIEGEPLYAPSEGPYLPEMQAEDEAPRKRRQRRHESA